MDDDMAQVDDGVGSTAPAVSTGSSAPIRPTGQGIAAASRPQRSRLAALLRAIEAGLLERDTAARLALLAALSGEHVLLLGPPGTAKSELARRLHRCFADARYFERLLTRFTTPEELFGPLSLRALEDDRYERLVDGYLPTAGIAFLDEVFKANSAILNALLTLLNEREFDNGSARRRTPLVSVVAASNEVPSEEALLAFFDRFLVRIPVANVSDASFVDLLTLSAAASPVVEAVRSDELAVWLRARDAVALSPDAIQGLAALRAFAKDRQIVVSDRRWRQLAGLLRSAAWLDGRDSVDALDLWAAPYALAADPAQVPQLESWFVREVARADAQNAPWLTRAVEAFEHQLSIEASMRADGADDGAGKMALAQSVGGGSVHDDGMLRIVSASLEESLRKRWSPVHVAARVAQLDEVLAHTAAPFEQLSRELAALEPALRGRLWMPPSLVDRMLGNLRASLAQLQSLRARLADARTGFAALPTDAALPQREPEPVPLSA